MKLWKEIIISGTSVATVGAMIVTGRVVAMSLVAGTGILTGAAIGASVVVGGAIEGFEAYNNNGDLAKIGSGVANGAVHGVIVGGIAGASAAGAPAVAIAYAGEAIMTTVVTTGISFVSIETSIAVAGGIVGTVIANRLHNIDNRGDTSTNVNVEVAEEKHLIVLNAQDIMLPNDNVEISGAIDTRDVGTQEFNI